MLAKDPKNKEALFTRGTILSERGRYAEALTSLDQALAIDPNDDEILASKIIALAALHKTDDLRAILAKLPEGNPNRKAINDALAGKTIQ